MSGKFDDALRAISSCRRADRLSALIESNLARTARGSVQRGKVGEAALAATTTNVERATLDALAGILAFGTWPALSVATESGTVDPAIVELALSRGIPLKPPSARAQFWLGAWATREDAGLAEDALVQVGKHRSWAKILAASFVPREPRSDLDAWIDRATRTPACDRAIATIIARARSLAETLTAAQLPIEAPWLLSIAHPAVLARDPRLVGALRALSPLRVLRNSLPARTTNAAAARLLAAATPRPAVQETVLNYGNMQAVIVPPAPKAVPGTAPRIQLATRVLALAPALTRLHASLVTVSPTRSLVLDQRLHSLAVLLDHATPWWILDLGNRVGQQVCDAAHYLFEATTTAPFAPARTIFPWDALLTRIGEVMYRALAPATTGFRRMTMIRTLELWLASGFPAHLAAIRGIDLEVPAHLVPDLEREHAVTLITIGANRYFLRHHATQGDRVFTRGIEATRDTTFRVPDDAILHAVRTTDQRFDHHAIAITLELARTRGPVAYAPAISAAIGRATKLSPTAAALVWTAGYDPWLMSDKKRTEFGIARDKLDPAERELARPRLRELYVDAMPTDPRDLYDPKQLASRISTAWTRRANEVSSHSRPVDGLGRPRR